MQFHTLSPSAGLSTSHQNFGVEVLGDRVLAPRSVIDLLETQLGNATAEALLSLAESFPTAIAVQMDWDVSDVAITRDTLVASLDGVVDDAFLRPLEIPKRGYGALDPRGQRPA
jgi:hypothetical protein